MKEMLKEFIVQYGTAILIVCFLIMIFCFFGCSPKIITQIEKQEVHDTIRIRLKDSVYVEKTDTLKMYQKNDTVYLEKIKWRNQYAIKEVHDTITNINNVTEVKEIPVRKIPKFFSVCTILFWLLVFLIIACIYFKLKKR